MKVNGTPKQNSAMDEATRSGPMVVYMKATGNTTKQTVVDA